MHGVRWFIVGVSLTAFCWIVLVVSRSDPAREILFKIGDRLEVADLGASRWLALALVLSVLLIVFPSKMGRGLPLLPLAVSISLGIILSIQVSASDNDRTNYRTSTEVGVSLSELARESPNSIISKRWATYLLAGDIIEGSHVILPPSTYLEPHFSYLVGVDISIENYDSELTAGDSQLQGFVSFTGELSGDQKMLIVNEALRYRYFESNGNIFLIGESE